MAIKVDANKKQFSAQKGWAALPARLVGHLVSFLEPKEMLKAATVCKVWQANQSVDIVLQRALQRDFPPEGLTRAQFLQYHRSARTGAFQVKRLEAGEGMQFCFSEPGVSNCWVSVAKEKGACRVFDNNGQFVCAPDLKAVKIEEGQELPHKATSHGFVYLTEEELFLRITTGPPFLCGNAMGMSRVCVFSRNEGVLLRQFSLPRSRQLRAVYEKERQMIFEEADRNNTTVSVSDFHGKELWKKTFSGNTAVLKFCKERRSYFYLSEKNVLTEHALLGAEETRLDLSPLVPSNRGSQAFFFHVNSDNLCVQRIGDEREIRMFDLLATDPTKPHCLFTPHYWEGIHGTTLFEDSVFVPGQPVDILHDKQGKKLASFENDGKHDRRFFPLSGKRFLYCPDVTREGGWSLCNGRGERLCTFTFRLDLEKVSWDIRSTRPDKIAFFQWNAGVSLLDLTLPPEEGKK